MNVMRRMSCDVGVAESRDYRSSKRPAAKVKEGKSYIILYFDQLMIYWLLQA
jgi:hypothetical protein